MVSSASSLAKRVGEAAIRQTPPAPEAARKIEAEDAIKALRNYIKTGNAGDWSKFDTISSSFSEKALGEYLDLTQKDAVLIKLRNALRPDASIADIPFAIRDVIEGKLRDSDGRVYPKAFRDAVKGAQTEMQGAQAEKPEEAKKELPTKQMAPKKVDVYTQLNTLNLAIGRGDFDAIRDNASFLRNPKRAETLSSDASNFYYLRLFCVFFGNDTKKAADYLQNISRPIAQELPRFIDRVDLLAQTISASHLFNLSNAFGEQRSMLSDGLNKFKFSEDAVAQYLLGPVILSQRADVSLYDVYKDYAGKEKKGLSDFLASYHRLTDRAITAEAQLRNSGSMRISDIAEAYYLLKKEIAERVPEKHADALFEFLVGKNINLAAQDRKTDFVNAILKAEMKVEITEDGKKVSRNMSFEEARLAYEQGKLKSPLPLSEDAKMTVGGETFTVEEAQAKLDGKFGRISNWRTNMLARLGKENPKGFEGTGLTKDQALQSADTFFRNMGVFEMNAVLDLLNLMSSRGLSATTQLVIINNLRTLQAYRPELLPFYISSAVKPLLGKTMGDGDSRILFTQLDTQLKQFTVSSDLTSVRLLVYIFNDINDAVGKLQYGFNRYELLKALSIEDLLNKDLKYLDYIVDHTGALRSLSAFQSAPVLQLYAMQRLTILSYLPGGEIVRDTTPGISARAETGKFEQVITPELVRSTQKTLLNPLTSMPYIEPPVQQNLFDLTALTMLVASAFMRTREQFGGLVATAYGRAGAKGIGVPGTGIGVPGGKLESAGDQTSILGSGKYSAAGPRGATLDTAATISGSKAGEGPLVTQGAVATTAANLGGTTGGVQYGDAGTEFLTGTEQDYVDARLNTRLRFFEEQAKKANTDIMVFSNLTYRENQRTLYKTRVWMIWKDGSREEVDLERAPEEVKSYIAARVNEAAAKISVAATRRGDLEKENKMMAGFAAFDLSLIGILPEGKEASMAAITKKIKDDAAMFWQNRGVKGEGGAATGYAWNPNNAFAALATYATPAESEGKEMYNARIYYFHYGDYSRFRAHVGLANLQSMKAGDITTYQPYGGFEWMTPQMFAMLQGSPNAVERLSYLAVNEAKIYSGISGYVDSYYSGPGFTDSDRMMAKFTLLRLYVDMLLNLGTEKETKAPRTEAWPVAAYVLYKHGDFVGGAEVRHSNVFQNIESAFNSVQDPKATSESRTSAIANMVNQMKEQPLEGYLYLGVENKLYFAAAYETKLQKGFWPPERAEGTTVFRVGKDGLYLGFGGRVNVYEKPEAYGTRKSPLMVEEKGRFKAPKPSTADQMLWVNAEVPLYAARVIFGKDNSFRVDLEGQLGEGMKGINARAIVADLLVKNLISSTAAGYLTLPNGKLWQGEALFSYTWNGVTVFMGANIVDGKIKTVSPPVSIDQLTGRVVEKDGKLVAVDPKVIIVPLGISFMDSGGGKISVVAAGGYAAEGDKIPIQLAVKRDELSQSYGAAFGLNVPASATLSPDITSPQTITGPPGLLLNWVVRLFYEYRSPWR